MMQPSISPRNYPEMIRRIKASKEAQGLSHRELAKRAKVSTSTLWSLLNGDPGRIYTFLQVLDALGLEIQII